MRTHPLVSPRSAAALVAVLALLGAVAVGAFGDDDPSVRTEPVTTTSEPPTTSTSTEPTPTTTIPPTVVPAGMQAVEYGGLRLFVPESWPVHDLAASPTTCIQADEHGVFLGEQGDEPDCPAHATGRTETVWMSPLSDRHQIDAARATTATSINGLAARIDPQPELNGALTVIFPDQHLLLVITFGDARTVADAILASVGAAGG